MVYLFTTLLTLLALVLIARLSEQLRSVNERLADVNARLRRLEETPSQAPRPVARAVGPAPVPPLAASPSVAAPLVVPPVAAPVKPATVAEPAPRPEPGLAAAGTRADLETEIGSRWALIIGVLVLVLGVAFFVKYAFDRRWISETFRVAAGTIVGAGLWIAGVRFAGRGYPLYGRMVAGGGLAILYLAAYAASVLYGLVPAGAALAWMACVSGVTAVTADRQNSAGLATMAIVLAFTAPYLVSTNQDQHIVLFVYDAVLIAATLALIRRHEWIFLALASFLLTWVTFAGWSSEWYRASFFGSAEIYLTVVTVMFLAILKELQSSRIREAPLVRGALWLALPLYHCASVAILYDHSMWLLLYFIIVNAFGVALLPDRAWRRLLLWAATAAPFLAWTQMHASSAWYVATVSSAIGLYALHLAGQRRGLDIDGEPPAAEMMLFHLNGLGLFAWLYPAVYAHASSTAVLAATLSLWNAALAYALRRRQAAGAMPHALALAFTFAAIAAAIRLSGPWMTVAWAAEGAAVVWVGLEIRRPWMRAGGVALMACAIGHLGVTQFSETLASFTLLLNTRMATGAFIVTLLYVAAALHLRYAPEDARRWAAGFIGAANVLTVALLTADVYSFWEVRGQQFTAAFKREASISVMWAAYGMGLVGLGFNRRSAVLRYLGLALLGLTVTKLFLVDLLNLDGIYRIAGFMVLGLVLLAASFLYHRASRRERPV